MVFLDSVQHLTKRISFCYAVILHNFFVQYHTRVVKFLLQNEPWARNNNSVLPS